jgi:2-amino-4-hydroxy-6-hydroxymethyldihydropteridine diphosphokinase
MTRAFIGLGANLGERRRTIEAALSALAETAEVDVEAVSSFRETEPVGDVDQPLFLNGVALIETTLAPRDLLTLLLRIEADLGRTREPRKRFGPRAIDLDILLYGDCEIDEPGLTIPHPRLHERRFALEPLAELDPHVVVLGHGSVRDLLAS